MRRHLEWITSILPVQLCPSDSFSKVKDKPSSQDHSYCEVTKYLKVIWANSIHIRRRLYLSFMIVGKKVTQKTLKKHKHLPHERKGAFEDLLLDISHN